MSESTKMKLYNATAIASLLFCNIALAASSLDVSSVIHSFYPTSTPVVEASVSTKLASALWSVEHTWTDSSAYTSVNEAIFNAAPESVQASIAASGYAYGDVVTATWYTKVPQNIKDAVNRETSAFNSAANKVLATSTSSGDAGRITALAMAGVVGIAGAIVAL